MMYKRIFKRVIDIILALLATPFVLLVILIFGPIIYFSDKGPIFYNASRLGQKGSSFKMFKLRTMIVNAPDLRLPDGSTYNSDDDPRVTRVGKLLRKTSLDEFPQFLNVLIGDMSIIGPRPDTVDQLPSYQGENIIILDIRPGITGYNQAFFRNSIDASEKMKNDCFYVKNMSFRLDLKIFFSTISAVVLRKNINH